MTGGAAALPEPAAGAGVGVEARSAAAAVAAAAAMEPVRSVLEHVPEVSGASSERKRKPGDTAPRPTDTDGTDDKKHRPEGR
jgi:hypothetical protein